VSTRALGIDFGERRIGLALSDPDGRIALPLDTLLRTDDRSAVRRIVEVARDNDVGRLVIGEPLGPDGERGSAADRVQRFARRLARESGLPVETVDETLTSVEAAERLRAAGVDPRRSPGRLDAVAAPILLQEALDRGRPEDGR
jgi:putative Holliday junction resolvase